MFLAVSPLVPAIGESTDAAYQEGMRAYSAEEYGRAMEILKPLAESGHTAAQYHVGRMHEKGYGVPKDGAEALPWYRLAAEGGHAKSQYKIGVAYAYARGGVQKDEAEAGKWFMKAAEQGYRKGQQAVARGYKKGVFGFPKDKKKATYWSDKAEKKKKK